MGNALNFWNNETCELVFYDDKVISVDLPTSITKFNIQSQRWETPQVKL